MPVLFISRPRDTAEHESLDGLMSNGNGLPRITASVDWFP